MASLVLSVLIVVGLVSILIISQTGAEALTGKGYSDLSSEQKQKYWDCFNSKCKSLLKEAQLSKKYTAYRDCSLNCNALAQSSSVVWCNDTDGMDYSKKGTVYSNVYTNGKEDYCHTFSNGKTYLMEGRCKGNKYGYVQKKCEEMGEYECKEGGCVEKEGPKVYSGPGTYTLYVGDSIVGKDYIYMVKEIGISLGDNVDYVAGELNISFKENILFTDEYRPMKLILFYAEGPFITEYGANIQLHSISLNQIPEKSIATILVYDTCTPIYNYCKKVVANNIIPGLFCDALCDYSTALPNREYSFKENVVVSMPQGYSTALEVAAQNAQNCYEGIGELYDVKPKVPVYVAYIASDSDNCGVGNYFGNVLCEVSIKYSNENINNNLDFMEIKDKVSSGACVSKVGSILNLQYHEITHKYTHRMIPAMGSFLDEGVATYTSTIVDKGNDNTLVCQDEGYYYSLSPNTFYPYNQLSASQYQTGACFLTNLKEKYGEEKFKAIFKYASTLNIGCYHLFADIINPVVGEDAFPIFKEKYKLTEDPEECTSQAIISS